MNVVSNGGPKRSREEYERVVEHHRSCENDYRNQRKFVSNKKEILEKVKNDMKAVDYKIAKDNQKIQEYRRHLEMLELGVREKTKRREELEEKRDALCTVIQDEEKKLIKFGMYCKGADLLLMETSKSEILAKTEGTKDSNGKFDANRDSAKRRSAKRGRFEETQKTNLCDGSSSKMQSTHAKPNDLVASKLGVIMLAYRRIECSSNAKKNFELDLEAFLGEKHRPWTSNKIEISSYDVLHKVLTKGGFEVICKKKLLAQLLREVGANDLSSRSFKEWYSKHLQKYEREFVKHIKQYHLRNPPQVASGDDSESTVTV